MARSKRWTVGCQRCCQTKKDVLELLNEEKHEVENVQAKVWRPPKNHVGQSADDRSEEFDSFLQLAAWNARKDLPVFEPRLVGAALPPIAEEQSEDELWPIPEERSGEFISGPCWKEKRHRERAQQVAVRAHTAEGGGDCDVSNTAELLVQARDDAGSVSRTKGRGTSEEEVFLKDRRKGVKADLGEPPRVDEREGQEKGTHVLRDEEGKEEGDESACVDVSLGRDSEEHELQLVRERLKFLRLPPGDSGKSLPRSCNTEYGDTDGKGFSDGNRRTVTSREGKQRASRNSTVVDHGGPSRRCNAPGYIADPDMFALEATSCKIHIQQFFDQLSSSMTDAGSHRMSCRLQNANNDGVETWPSGSEAAAFYVKACGTMAIFRNFEQESFGLKNKEAAIFSHPSSRQIAFMEDFNTQSASHDSVLQFTKMKTELLAETFGYPREDWPDLLTESCSRALLSVWGLHKLAFAFEPPVTMFQVFPSTSFDPLHMEPICTEKIPKSVFSKFSGLVQVQFMVTPGFHVQDKLLVRSQVYCASRKAT